MTYHPWADNLIMKEAVSHDTLSSPAKTPLTNPPTIAATVYLHTGSVQSVLERGIRTDIAHAVFTAPMTLLEEIYQGLGRLVRHKHSISH